MNTDEITLTINRTVFGGWQDIRVTRGIEVMPSSFDISLTELYPSQAAKLVIMPGAECTVSIGNSGIINGYVDSYAPSFDAHSHVVRVTGRGRCQDLVDCCANFISRTTLGTGQINLATALDVAKAVAAPFNIQVNRIGSEASGTIPQFNILIGETGYEVIDRVARYRKLLVYEGVDGSLILAQAGTQAMASGFVEGVNIEAASISYSANERFSDYLIFFTNVNDHQVIEATGGNNGSQHGTARDAGVTRFRPHAEVFSQFDRGTDLGQAYAEWQMNRRYGRSQTLNITTDNWRDKAGKLWSPNCLVDITIPSLKLDKVRWLISEVVFRRDASGTHADLVIMPKEAFLPEPIGLHSEFQIANALNQTGADADLSVNPVQRTELPPL